MICPWKLSELRMLWDACLKSGLRTPDIAGKEEAVTTEQMTNRILGFI